MLFPSIYVLVSFLMCLVFFCLFFLLCAGRRMFSADNAGLINVWKTAVSDSRHQSCPRWCIEKVQHFVMSDIMMINSEYCDI